MLATSSNHKKRNRSSPPCYFENYVLNHPDSLGRYCRNIKALTVGIYPLVFIFFPASFCGSFIRFNLMGQAIIYAGTHKADFA